MPDSYSLNFRGCFPLDSGKPTNTWLMLIDVSEQKGFPNSVALRSGEPEIQYMDKFLDERTLAEIQLWKPKPWYEAWHEKNTFWIC